MVVIAPDGDGNHYELFVEKRGNLKVFDKAGNHVAEFVSCFMR